MGTPAALADRLAVIRAAADALSDLDGDLHQAQGCELAALATLFDTVASRAARARTAVVAEAVTRHEVDGTVNGWIRTHAPSLRQGGFGATSRLVTEATKGGPLWSNGAPVPDPDTPIGIVWAATRGSGSGDSATPALTPANALAVLSEMRHLQARLHPEATPTVTRALVDLCLEWGPGHMRKLRPRLLALYGQDGEVDDLHDRLAKAAHLSSPQVRAGDLTEYRMALTPAQAATLEAALGPLAKPAPNPTTGEKDLRPAGQRRAEALIEICRRAAAAGLEAGGGGPCGAYAALHVTMTLEHLRALTRCTEAVPGSPFSVPSAAGASVEGDLLSGEVLGSCAEGIVLSPQTLRILACHADLIPHVLGSEGEHLDQGREIRLYNRAQRRTLLRRDKHCTYPGCDRPGAWTRAHHVQHWFDGGASDLSNAALLCERHHTIVHRRRLWAEVRDTPDEQGRFVVWDLVEGSYDRELERRRAERRHHDPPPITPQLLAALSRAHGSTDGDERAWASHLSAWYDPGPDDEPDLDPVIWDEAPQTVTDVA